MYLFIIIRYFIINLAIFIVQKNNKILNIHFAYHGDLYSV